MTKSLKTDMAPPQSSSLPNGWHIVRFGDVAKKISDIVDRKNCDLDHFVAGEHMQTDDFRIKEWGTMDNGYLGPAFNHKFSKGQILYGSRRTYLRKVSIPHFDGVCANTTFVIEPTGDDLIPELLPFVMQSAGFNEQSIRMSKGSTNPYINWKDIACYEFAVPEKKEQRRIATTLWATEDCIVKGERFVAAAEQAKQVLMRELFSKGIGHFKFKGIKWIGNVPEGWHIIKIKDFTTVIRGASPRPKGDSRYYDGPVPRLMTEDVTRDGMWVHAEIDSLTEDGAKLSRFLKKGSLVLICSGGKETVGLPGLLSHDACIHDGFLALTKINDTVANEEFLYYWFLYYQKTMEQIATHGCAFINLTTDIISNLTITLPPLQEQRQIVSILSHCDSTIAASRTNLIATRALKMKLIGQFFSRVGN